MPFFTLPPFPQIQYKAYAEDRERFERRLNKDFDVTRADNRNDLFSRWRVGAKLTYGMAWRGEVQWQYCSDALWTKTKNSGTWNSDLGLGYVETDAGGWTVDAGRQKINIGQQRLIGSFEWNNIGRSFDALRLKDKTWDAFAFRIGLASPLPGEARVAGIIHMSPSYGDTMYVFKHDRTSSGDVDIHTFDQNLTHAFGPMTVDAEVALQFGRSLGKDQRAWALHAWGTLNAWHGVKPFVEVNSASGGSTATQSRTFDNLYPTNHAKYGIADMIAWKNMNHIAAGSDFTPRRDLSLRVSYNVYSLRDSRDAWYGASGTPNTHAGNPLKDPTGASGTALGNEVDLDSSYGLSRSYSLGAGVAVFNPGSFVRNLTGHLDRQFWGYLQVTAKF